MRAAEGAALRTAALLHPRDRRPRRVAIEVAAIRGRRESAYGCAGCSCRGNGRERVLYSDVAAAAQGLPVVPPALDVGR